MAINLLPDRYAYCSPPIAEQRRPLGYIIPSEESASLWLWAWPRLLGWPRRINWLFSPVTGNKDYPGDLWGVDSSGYLIVVETKINRGAILQDPFEDFVPYIESGANSHYWSSEALFNRWRDLLTSELTFIARDLPNLCPHRRPSGTYRGVVPYSFHRDAVWRWQELYRSQIVPRLVDASYKRAVKRSLRLREALPDSPPVFVGLVVSVRPGELILSTRGMAAFRILRACVGQTPIVLRGVRATLSANVIRVRCWSPSWVTAE
jgi:hypothetical protein